MTPEEKQQLVDYSVEIHHAGYNCAQCVAVAAGRAVGLDPDATFCLMEGFGAGMGGKTQACGALSGAVAAVGQASTNGREACNSKKQTYGWVSQLVDQFQQRYGHTACQDLRPEDPAQVMEVCDGYIAAATEMALCMVERVQAAKAE